MGLPVPIPKRVQVRDPAALLCDGDIIAIGEEERFIRVKHGVDHLRDKIVTDWINNFVHVLLTMIKRILGKPSYVLVKVNSFG